MLQNAMLGTMADWREEREDSNTSLSGARSKGELSGVTGANLSFWLALLYWSTLSNYLHRCSKLCFWGMTIPRCQWRFHDLCLEQKDYMKLPGSQG